MAPAVALGRMAGSQARVSGFRRHRGFARDRLRPRARADDDDDRSARWPKGSRDLDSLHEELAKMDLDAVTQQFGDNFGPRPDFFKDRTVDDLKSEFENLIDLEEVGGVFSSEMAGKVKLSELEQEDASEDAWSEQAKEAEETEAKAEEAEERKEVDDWGAKMGWDPATEEHEQMWKDVEASVQAADPLADVPKEEYEEMSNFIMQLVHAGDQFESLVEENIHRIDEKLLTLLERRISLSAQEESDMRIVTGLQNIWKRLAAEMERRDAPDELKLLDTCLTIMMPDDPMQEFDPKLMLARKGEVVELLGEAFALPGSRHRPVDIFEMARKIGPQQSLDIEKLEAEQGDIWGSDVTRESFIEMVREVIKETQERQAEEYEALKEIKHEVETMEYTGEEKVMAREEIEKIELEMEAQKRVLGVTREVMEMAQAMTWT